MTAQFHSHPLSDHPENLTVAPSDCPDLLCLADLTDNSVCYHCPRKPKPYPNCPQDCEYSLHCQTDPDEIEDYCPRPQNGWGGKRPGAGAPAHNLNAFTHGNRSKLLQVAIDKLASDPELRAFLFMVARAASAGKLSQTTKQLILKAVKE